VRLPAVPDMPGMAGSHENWGKFKCHKWGEYGRHSQLPVILNCRGPCVPHRLPKMLIVLRVFLLDRTLFERRRDRSAGVLCALNLRVFIGATIGGSGAFVVPIDDFGSFGDAMLRKLVSEIARK